MLKVTITYIPWLTNVIVSLVTVIADNEELKSITCRPEKEYVIFRESFRMLCDTKEYNKENTKWAMDRKVLCFDSACLDGYTTGEEGPYIYLQIDKFKEFHFTNYIFSCGFELFTYHIDESTTKIYSYPLSNETVHYKLEDKKTLTMNVSFEDVRPIPKCFAKVDGDEIELKIIPMQSENSTLLFDVKVEGNILSNKDLHGQNIHLSCRFGRKHFRFDKKITEHILVNDIEATTSQGLEIAFIATVSAVFLLTFTAVFYYIRRGRKCYNRRTNESEMGYKQIHQDDRASVDTESAKGEDSTLNSKKEATTVRQRIRRSRSNRKTI